jgi:holo-[acyl-carrier protein] synthase
MVVARGLAAGGQSAVIVGIGTDLISVARIAKVYERQGRRFLDRVYTPAELTYCLSARDPSERLAARWAAKEACMKAMGTGWAKGIGFTQIGLIPGDDRGAPRVVMSDAAKSWCDAHHVATVHCSVSHSDGFAIAMVVLES